MRFFLTLVTLSILQQYSYAQSPNQGYVSLSNGETINGEVDINAFINSAIVTTDDNRQLTYHASMINSIQTVDACDHRREYRCFDYKSNSFFDRLEKKVFQVVAEGDIMLLRRVFEYDVFDATDEYTIDEFYTIDSQKKVRRIKNFKRQVLPLMENYADEMDIFKKRNRLGSLNKEVNMYLMISYYNRLKDLEGDATLTLK